MGENKKFSNQHLQMSSFDSIAQNRFYEFAKYHKNWFINFSYNERLRQMLKMIYSEVNRIRPNACVLDIGCGDGAFSSVLSLQFATAGLDVGKVMNSEVKAKFKKLNFIIADMRFMPFRNHTMDVVVCSSVLEHCQDLEDQVMKIKDVLKKDGIFVAGYPVETKLFKFVWKRVSPLSFLLIDCERARNQPIWINPITNKQERYWDNWRTHKQNYQKIRNVLRSHFEILQEKDLPLNILPDSLTYYECVKMRNVI